MGKLVVTIGVGDQQGRQFEDLEVTVDTGSTFTAVPRALLQRLGVPVRRSARSPAGRRKLGPSGHRLDSGQAGGPDLRNTGDIRRGKTKPVCWEWSRWRTPCWQWTQWDSDWCR